MKIRNNLVLRNSKLLLVSLMVFALPACQKGYLSKRPDQSLLVPASLSDFQALMDNQQVFNIVPVLPVISSDDFQTDDAGFNALPTGTEKNAYTWAKDIFAGEPSPDWDVPYQQVFYANVVLDGLSKLDPGISGYNSIKGSALFLRAQAYEHLLTEFAKAYDPASAGTDPGVPLRLSPDVNVKSGRASVQACYDQLIADLITAQELLPVTVAYKSRPSRVAAAALLARVYLEQGAYGQALAAATTALGLNSTLIDYNTLDATSENPFPYTPVADNPELLFYDKLVSYTFSSAPNTTIPEALYTSYADNDLRKTVFFAGAGPHYFKGRYTGADYLLTSGLTVDELYLVRAECEARGGDATAAMGDLNTLLEKRWKTGTFQPFGAGGADAALEQVLTERRKELVLRGLRWADLKRLNRDPGQAITLSRTVNGKVYQLAPGDRRYLLPIPAKEIAGSGITQNER